MPKQLYYETLHSGLVLVEPVRKEERDPAMFLHDHWVVLVVGDHDKRASDGGFYRDGEEMWCREEDLVNKAPSRGINAMVRQADLNEYKWGEG